jgi:hypothetical protein
VLTRLSAGRTRAELVQYGIPVEGVLLFPVLTGMDTRSEVAYQALGVRAFLLGDAVIFAGG